MNLEDYALRLNQILSDISITQHNGWVRPTDFSSWVDRYNNIVRIFNSQYSRQIMAFGIMEQHYSKSGKTVTGVAVQTFEKAVNELKNEIERLKKALDDELRFHCFKIGNKCPHKIDPKHYKFFIGMPFSDKYIDSYEYGIKLAIASFGVDCTNQVFRADEKFDNVDIMCKICKALRESESVIIDISDANPNVMFELGLAYGLNKRVFLLKDTATSVVSDLKGLEYIEYEHAVDLHKKLVERFQALKLI